MKVNKFKTIVVMPDFCSSGLWNGKDGIMIDYEELNLSKQLIKDFSNWINYLYDKGYKKDYSGLRNNWVATVYEEGFRLAKELKKLFPDIKIIYKSEHTNLNFVEEVIEND